MAESKVIYRPRADACPQSELSALVAAYRYVIFDCHASDKDAGTGAPDAETNSKGNFTSDDSIQ